MPSDSRHYGRFPVTDAAHDITSHQQIHAAFTWDLETLFIVGNPLRSADASSIITEIITTPSRRTGNAMGMTFTKISGDGTVGPGLASQTEADAAGTAAALVAEMGPFI